MSGFEGVSGRLITCAIVISSIENKLKKHTHKSLPPQTHKQNLLRKIIKEVTSSPPQALFLCSRMYKQIVICVNYSKNENETCFRSIRSSSFFMYPEGDGDSLGPGHPRGGWGSGR